MEYNDINQGDANALTLLYELLASIDPLNAPLLCDIFRDKKVTANQMYVLAEDELKYIVSPEHHLNLYLDFKQKFIEWKLKQVMVNQVTTTANHTPKNNEIIDINNLVEYIVRNKYTDIEYKIKNESKHLKPAEIRHLLDYIKNYFMKNKLKMELSDMKKLTKQIVVLFPNETKSTYFRKVTKTQKSNNGKIVKKTIASGKLYNKWVNRNKSNQSDNSGDDENDEIPEDVAENNGEQVAFGLSVIEPVLESEIEDLESSRKNLAIRTAFPIATNLEAWNDLRRYRFHMIKNDKTVNIWEKWPLYTHVDAACLIFADFDALFTNIHSKLSHYWDKIEDELFKLYNMEVVDNNYKKLLQDFQEKRNVLSPIARTAFLLHMLPTILKPTGRPQRSVADAQDCFVAHFKEATDLNECQTPRVVLIGPSLFDIKQIFMNFNGHNFQCDNSPLQALELAFMSFWNLDKSYPLAAKNVFIFIQEFFYETEIQYQVSSPDVKRITQIFKQILRTNINENNNLE